jgi:hypothetical protein
LGYYENFPKNIHTYESFSTTISSKKLQQNLIQLLHDINRKELCFEEVANPTIPKATVIFEFGLAEDGNFNFIDENERKKVLKSLTKDRLGIMDFFCAIRYYRDNGDRKTALKFDYYLLRAIFGKNNLEIQVFHERGPRYISPQDLVDFLHNKLNWDKSKRLLKKRENE